MSGSIASAISYIRRRHVQKSPRSAWVRPRRARWKACECAFVIPGIVRPGKLVARGGGSLTPTLTSAIRSPSSSTRTPASARSPPSQASSHQSALGSFRRSRFQLLLEPGDPPHELVALVAVELLPGGERPRIRPVDEEDAVEVIDLVLEGAGRQAAL